MRADTNDEGLIHYLKAKFMNLLKSNVILRLAQDKEDRDWQDMLLLGVEMRRALASICDGSGKCTCVVCRAAWGWDHKYGVITRFNQPDHFDEEEINPWKDSTF